MVVPTERVMERVETLPEIPDVPIWRLTVDDYHRMIDAGILQSGDPLELLEGWLVAKIQKKPKHSFMTQLTREVLARILPDGWFVDAQEPITTSDSEPEPDVAVIRGHRADYTERHPYPNEVGLVIEVSDTTLQQDRTLKLRFYASARIPIYWIFNLVEGQLEVYSLPTGSGSQATYTQRMNYGASDRVPVILDGREGGQLALSDVGL